MTIRLIQLVIFSVLSFLQVFGQQPATSFFNKDDKPTVQDSAFYYRIGKRNEKEVYEGEVKDYYVKNNQLKQQAIYHEGHYHGAYTTYFENGQISSSGYYVDGRYDGPWKWWYADGRLKEQGLYKKDDTPLDKYPTIFRTRYIIEAFWDSTGTQRVKEGNGEWFDTHPNNQLRTKGKYVNGHQEGEWLGFYDDGKPYYIEQYHLGKLVEGKSYSKEDQTFTYTEDEMMPEFKGGQEELMRFLASTTRYPTKSLRKGIEGSVFVGFVINREGKVSEAHVLKGISKDCDQEALRVVNAMPAWQPGLQRGQPVPVKYVLPINYRIDH
jgi:TonB family protein